MLQLPGGTVFGPIQQYNNVQLEPYQIISISGIEQQIPIFAPLGTYRYISYIGLYPGIIIDSALFEFTVTSPETGGATSWASSGWFDESIESLPESAELLACYPNPFNPVTTFRYNLPSNCRIELGIFNLMGQKVATLIDGYQSAGQKSIKWNASHLASGIYFYRLTAGDKVFTKRMTLLK